MTFTPSGAYLRIRFAPLQLDTQITFASVTGRRPGVNKQPFVDSYLNLIQKIARFLPDMDIPVNHMDEPRVLISWEVISAYMKDLEISLSRQDIDRVPRLSSFRNRTSPRLTPGSASFVSQPPYWNVARQACPRNSQARTVDVDIDFSTPPIFPAVRSAGTYQGFVRNWSRHSHKMFVATPN
jgi:hypothetical protein